MVTSWVSTSTRLCTCMRSSRFTRRRSNDRCMESIPACLPLVQTLVARKSELRRCSSLVRSPITLSARPYIGELSITLPPSWTKRARTSLSGCRSLGEAPTSNTCQVPRPTAGIFSPVAGMARDSIVVSSAARSGIEQRAAAAAPPITRAASRRVIETSNMVRKSLPRRSLQRLNLS